MIYLIGASGHAKVIIEILEANAAKIACLSDVNPDISSLLDYSVGRDLPEEFELFRDEVIVSIGDNITRKKIVSENSYNYSVAIHSNAYISKRSTIGKGTVIMAGVSINSGAKIGAHVIVNTNASIDHDCCIADFVHISPNVALAGDVKIGEGTHIGIGACILQGLTIGKWAIIGAGAVIINNIPDYTVVVGNPGKVIKYKYHDAE